MNTKHPITILVVDDDRSHRIMLCSLFKDWGWTAVEADDGSAAVLAVEKRPFDAILMDVRMARMDGMTALKKIHGMNPAIPVVIMTAYGAIDAAVEAMKNGAHDYLTKPLDFNRLKMTLSKALGHREAVEALSKKDRLSPDLAHTAGIIGKSLAMLDLLRMVALVAPTEATVLITGESGTGKELVATALHQNSARAKGPLVKVNCAALVENLLESELFGHEKGAFTGADRRREGKFIQAGNGTIFLDEISETSPAMQAKLLRVLQEHEIQRVGGQETLVVDVRVIAATNRVLEDDVREGRFREDLFYRLNVVTVRVPGLRERPEDIPLLVDHFVKKFAEKNRRTVEGVTPRAMDHLVRYPWPGNVRELENAIERGVILMRGDYLDADSLPLPVKKWAQAHAGDDSSSLTGHLSTLEKAEKEVILRTLEETGGNKSEAARRLNITRKTLLSKLNKYRKGT